VWEDGALNGLRMAAEAGVRVTVITNQSGVGRGVMSTTDVEAVHRHMRREAELAGGRIDAVLVCPHAPEAGCGCRKPAPGLAEKAIEAAGIAPEETVLVGDMERDLETARRAGIRAVLVRTGKGRQTEASRVAPPVPVFDDLRDAVAALLDGDD
jgi:D-glycero-D-manno-heptose 1,7-bisphosphate phosphatase